MTKKMISRFDSLIIRMLACIGLLNACEGGNNYGSPSADFEVKGTVTSHETGKALEGIRIIPHLIVKASSDTTVYYPYRDTIYTDAQGQYRWMNTNDLSLINGNRLVFEDVDGEANGGLFAKKAVDVVYTESDRVKKGDGKWYEGAFSKTEDVALENTLSGEE